jgi:hypothetical protein
LDSSPIATPKLVASSGLELLHSNGKGASHFFGTHTSKPMFYCTFYKKDGHTVEFSFRRIKHERCVRAMLLRIHVTFLMVRVIQMLAPSRVLRLMLLALSPKGLLTYKRMVIRPLKLFLSIGLYTISLFVGRMGIKRAFATAVQGKCADLCFWAFGCSWPFSWHEHM